MLAVLRPRGFLSVAVVFILLQELAPSKRARNFVAVVDQRAYVCVCVCALFGSGALRDPQKAGGRWSVSRPLIAQDLVSPARGIFHG